MTPSESGRGAEGAGREAALDTEGKPKTVHPQTPRSKQKFPRFEVGGELRANAQKQGFRVTVWRCRSCGPRIGIAAFPMDFRATCLFQFSAVAPHVILSARKN